MGVFGGGEGGEGNTVFMYSLGNRVKWNVFSLLLLGMFQFTIFFFARCRGE